jgi:hypothetical protein
MSHVVRTRFLAYLKRSKDENSALPQNSKTGKSIKKKHEVITVQMAEAA